MMFNSVGCAVWVVLLGLAAGPVVRGEIVYDNSTAGRTNFYLSPFEYGDEIRLGGVTRTVTDFMFEYYGEFEALAEKQARLRLYLNDGAGQFPTQAPGSVIYDSGYFTVAPGVHSPWVSGINVEVPESFTWAVEFRGFSLAPGDTIGLLLVDPPTIGSSFRDFWVNRDGSWALFLLDSGEPANFGARVMAIPEPATLGYSLLAGLAFVCWRWQQRRAQR